MPFSLLLMLLLITIIWGYAWIFMKVSLYYMGPFTFAFFRFAAGSLVMLFISSLRSKLRPANEDWPYLALLGLMQTALTFTLLMYGMVFVSAGKSSVLLYTMPIWSMVLAYFFLQEKITGRKIGSLLLGSSGLLLILGWDIVYRQNLKVLMGESLIILGALSWAAANIIIKKRFNCHDKIMVSTWQMVFGTAGIALAALAMEWGKPVLWAPLPVFSVLFCGVLASAFCFTAWFIILSRIDTTAASISLMFVPVIAVFSGWLHLNEEINASMLAGVLLISFSIYLASVQKKNRRQKNTIDRP
ncbi:protein of unknown function DUF6 transmembrane [Desulfofarcimen acetoxidans DSM 771]|uniref:EamA domain-containing protein n=1 Tax=Desulfofarcimen acetoxidans (strain ATCC 49208 / DSM 771 / KCTC 5769 / VKM B-1644 / 5575) TaxID=485916 RepID=C8W0Y9_DESAS|nr:DMT family transporter [Desulfofarcimen acetoxidans]ACV63385.1 protein of unknown function DUF6 transmembrane [Desulfofarcimen acetoxidans DSM 771]